MKIFFINIGQKPKGEGEGLLNVHLKKKLI
jgi:hypothetical protein